METYRFENLAVSPEKEGAREYAKVSYPLSYYLPCLSYPSNAVGGADLPAGHLPSLIDLLRSGLPRPFPKGGVYLSPLVDTGKQREQRNREILRDFRKVKVQSPLPAYLYLIQRL